MSKKLDTELDVELDTELEVSNDVEQIVKTITSKIEKRQRAVKKKKEYESEAKSLETEIIKLLKDNDIRHLKANDDKNGAVKLNKKSSREVPFVSLFELRANKYLADKDAYVITRERLEELSLHCKVTLTSLKDILSNKEIEELSQVTKVEEKYEFNAR